MTIRDTGRKTGPLTGKLSAPAPSQAAAPAARTAARTGGLSAAALKAQAEEKIHTGRLAAEAKAGWGKMPWEMGAAGLATGLGQTFDMLKDSRSVQKKIKDIKETVQKVRTAAKETGSRGVAALKKVASDETPKNPQRLLGANDPSKFDRLKKFDAGARIVGGAVSAANLKHSFAAMRDDASVKTVNNFAKDVIGTARGVDGVVQFATKGKDLAKIAYDAGKASKGIAGTAGKLIGTKLNPALALASAATTAVSSGQALASGKGPNGKPLTTTQKFSHVMKLGSAAADVVGIVFPPAKVVSAGLSLVSMGLDFFGK